MMSTKTELFDELSYLINVIKGYNPTMENLSLELAAALWNLWQKNVDEAFSEMVEADLREAGRLEELFKNKLSVEFPLEAEETIIETIKETFKYTKREFFSAFKKADKTLEKADDYFGYSLREKDFESITYLRDHTNWWMKNYYERFPGKKISEVINTGLGNELSTKKLGESLSDYFYGNVAQGELPEIPGNMSPKEYFEGLARNTVSRARMNSTVNNFLEAEIEEYEIIATEDGRTCDICRSMHGRVFKTSTAKKFVDKFNALDTPEQVKTQLPWIKSPAETAKPTNQLGLSTSLPPFHFQCRCDVLNREYTIEEESQRLLEDKQFQKDLPRDLLLTTDEPGITWNPSSIQEARMMVKIARKMKVYDKEFKRFVKKASWRNEKALVDHFRKHKNEFESSGIKLNSVDDYQQLSVDILNKGECWGIIESDTGYPQIIAVLKIKDKLFTSILNVKGMQLATSFPKSDFYGKITKGKEFYYFLRKAKLIKLRKWKKVMEKRDAQKLIESYKIKLDYDLDKSTWNDWTEPGGRIFPPEDAVAIVYNRDDIYDKLSSFSNDEKMLLKEADELLLNDPDTVCELFKYSHLDKKQPKEKWWYHFEDIRDGKLEVYWDEEKKVYTAE